MPERNPYYCIACGVDFSQGRDTGYCNYGHGCLNPEYIDNEDLFDEDDLEEDDDQ